MHVDEPCTAYFNYLVLDCPTTIYVFISVYIYAMLRNACVGVGIVVLGVSGIKPAGEGVFGTLAGMISKQPIWDRGWGYTPQRVPTLTVFGA
jgi:hypothetical protein